MDLLIKKITGLTLILLYVCCLIYIHFYRELLDPQGIVVLLVRGEREVKMVNLVAQEGSAALDLRYNNDCIITDNYLASAC